MDMAKHTIVLRREGMQGFLSDQCIETDAINAMSTMPGVKNPMIVSESESQVTVSFDWIGKEPFMQAGQHLLRYGLSTVLWKYGQ